MDVTVSKVLIIFGLLFTTLLAALLPLLCLKLTSRHRRRQRRKHSTNEGRTFVERLCCWKLAQKTVNTNKHENKMSLDNGSIRTTVSQRRHMKLRTKMIMSVLNCFAGGIFLGTSFNHLLPEIRENFEKFDIRWPKLTNSSGNMSNGAEAMQDPMPIAEIIVVIGLFFILCVEQTAHSCNHWRQKKKALQKAQPVGRFHADDLGTISVERGEINRQLSASSQSNGSGESLSKKPSHDHSGIRSLMLVTSLSLHSLLEGVAIGLQDSLGSVVAIFVAVLFHKCLMAFSMGTNLVRSKQTLKKIIAAAAILAFASPCGIAIGLVVKHAGGENNGTVLVNAILQSIATGAFLYITFFEVLVKEFDSHGDRLAKVLSLFVGYGAVLGSFFAHYG